MSKKLVIVDVDDVLIDLNDSVASFINLMGYSDFKSSNIVTYDLNKNINISLLPENQRDLQDNGLGCPRNLIIERYHESRVFLESKLTYKFHEGLKLLSENFDVVIYTSSWNMNVARCKMNMFDELCSDLSLNYCFGVGWDKPSYTNVHAVFEDCIENLSKYSDDCIKILVDRPQNCELFNKDLLSCVKNINRVKNFYEGVQYLLGGT